MKKKLQIVALSGIFLSFMAGYAMAADGDVMVYERLPGTEEVRTPPVDSNPGDVVYEEIQTNVPQAVIDYRDKRVEARERRSRMLKMRAETINALDAENAAGLEPLNNITDQL